MRAEHEDLRFASRWRVDNRRRVAFHGARSIDPPPHPAIPGINGKYKGIRSLVADHEQCVTGKDGRGPNAVEAVEGAERNTPAFSPAGPYEINPSSANNT